jgi:hypothetical protein
MLLAASESAMAAAGASALALRAFDDDVDSATPATGALTAAGAPTTTAAAQAPRGPTWASVVGSTNTGGGSSNSAPADMAGGTAAPRRQQQRSPPLDAPALSSSSSPLSVGTSTATTSTAASASAALAAASSAAAAVGAAARATSPKQRMPALMAASGSGALLNGGADVPDVCRLHVGALNVGLTRQDLHDVFSPFGAIDAIELVMPEGKPLGFAFIQVRHACASGVLRSLTCLCRVVRSSATPTAQPWR